MSTIDDYMQDEDIQAMPEYLREIHCIRRMMVEELDGMDTDTRARYLKENAIRYFTDLGLPPPKIVNLSGKGALYQPQHT